MFKTYAHEKDENKCWDVNTFVVTIQIKLEIYNRLGKSFIYLFLLEFSCISQYSILSTSIREQND